MRPIDYWLEGLFIVTLLGIAFCGGVLLFMIFSAIGWWAPAIILAFVTVPFAIGRVIRHFRPEGIFG